MKICIKCGKSFNQTSNVAKFCSEECRLSFYKKDIRKKCLYCGSIYTPTNNNSKFCSIDCKKWYNQPKYICKHCNKEYILNKNNISVTFCENCRDLTFDVKCKCGCDEIFTVDVHEVSLRQYKQGHGRKNRKNSEEHNLAISKANTKEKSEKIYKLCKCGCGELTCNKQYIHGHNGSSEISLKGVETRRKNGTLVCKEETKLKIRKANSGENNGMYNKTHDKEVKRLISIASIKYNNSDNAKYVKWLYYHSEEFNNSKMNNQEMMNSIHINNPDILVLTNFNNKDDIVKCKSKKCNHIWETKIKYLMYGSGCHKCNFSKNEILIEKFLKENNIQYVYQKRFKDCKNKKPLPFDFYLPNYNLCLEYDGEGHYVPYIFGENLNSFNEGIARDNIKTNFCNTNKIRLLRIPYWEKDNIKELLSFVFEEIKELDRTNN